MTKKTITLEDINEQYKAPSFVPNGPDSAKEPAFEGLLTDTQVLERNKYYLPRLELNKPEFWPNSENKKHFLPVVAEKTCLGNCSGVSGLKSACCRLNPHDIEHVLGPCNEDWIKEIRKKLFKKTGVYYSREDIVIDYEEGKQIGQAYFNDHPVFKNEDAYPILRMQLYGAGFGCKFLNVTSGKCSIYEDRPEFCRGYYCNYIKANFLVRKQGTNTQYVDLRKDSKEKDK